MYDSKFNSGNYTTLPHLNNKNEENKNLARIEKPNEYENDSEIIEVPNAVDDKDIMLNVSDIIISDNN